MRKGIFIAVLVAAIPLILLNLATPGVADEQDEAELYRVFDVKKVGADVVVAVDTSLSMKESFPKVTKALNSLSDIFQPRDRLTVIVFDNQARRIYRGPATAGSRIKKELPDKPNSKGHRTDMGAAVKLVLEELDDSQDKLPVVIFLTDGAEDPPRKSRFATEHDRAWSELKDEAEGKTAAKRAYVHGIGLNKNTDIDKLKRVWPQVQPLTLDPGDLSVYFVKLKEKIRRERLRLELGKELNQGKVLIRAGSPNWGEVRAGTTFKRTFTLTSTFKKLPVEVKVLGAGWGGFKSITKRRSLAKRLPQLQSRVRTVKLMPGQSRKVLVDVKVPRAKGGLGLKTQEKYRGEIKFDVSGSTRYAEAISNFDFDPSINISGSDQVVWLNRSVGQSIYLLVALALAALAAVAVFWRRAILPAGFMVYRKILAPPLFGRLAFSGAPAGEQLPRPLSLEKFGRRMTLGAEGQVRLKGQDIKKTHAEIFTQWEEGEPKVFISGLEGDVRVARTTGSAPVLIAGPTKLNQGSVIQIGGYKIQWI